MIALACDHGALELKNHLKSYLSDKGMDFRDFGTETAESCDYPDYVIPAAKSVADGECELGIVLCTTGIGASITANKVRGIRCALCHEPMSAELCRRHNDANMMAIGAGVTGPKLAERMVDVFLTTPFDGGRHQRRIDKITALEDENF